MIERLNLPKAVSPAKFSHLTVNPGFASGNNLGGKFALPPEFDTKRFAAGYYREGQEAISMQQLQPIQGTELVAPGWSVWRYPKKAEDAADVKASTKEKKKKKKTSSKADLAGQPHKVQGAGKDENFILMFRPLEVQDQINRAYADLSLTNMVAEAQGDTVAEEVKESGGILSAKILNRVGERDIEADREFEANDFGRSKAVGTAGKIGRRRETVVHGG